MAELYWRAKYGHWTKTGLKDCPDPIDPDFFLSLCYYAKGAQLWESNVDSAKAAIRSYIRQLGRTVGTIKEIYEGIR